MALYVTAVDENSPAEKFGITVGCALLAIDGHPLNDALDYQFYTTPKSFSLELCKDEQHRTVQVEKGEYEPLGCNFKTYLGDEKAQLRQPLYVLLHRPAAARHARTALF